jgi:SOS response regulatory protein OraA/RecX
MAADIQKELLQKAGAILARRSFSRGELREKLLKIADRAQVEIALDRLERLNLLNDAEYAYNFALYRIKQKGWSAAKVFNSLLKRWIERSVIESAIARIQDEGVEKSSLDFLIKNYREKKGRPLLFKDIAKLVGRLRRRGFDEDDIFQALEQAIPGAVSQRFEAGE